MQAYKTFFKIAKAKFRACIVYFIVFFILTVIMSFTAESDSQSNFQVSSVDICIRDLDESTASRGLYDYLCSMHTPVTFDSYDNETLQDNLYYEKISYVLIIPEGFEAALTEGGDTSALVQTVKRQDSASGYFVDQQVDGYIRALSLYLTGGFSVQEAVDAVSVALSDAPEVSLVSFSQVSADTGSQMYYFFQYLPYVLIMMLIEGLSPVLMVFRKKDIANRIDCSCAPAHSRNVQIAIGCITYTFGLWLVFMLLGIALYGAGAIFSQNGLLCLLNSFVFALFATALTLLVSVFPLNANALNMAANVIGLGMSFLCGIFVPQYYLGDNVLKIARFLPAYWYVRSNNMTAGFSQEAFSMSTYRIGIGIQLLFTAAAFCVYLAAGRQSKRSALA
jgi:ABC-2 type transport system permease protein